MWSSSSEERRVEVVDVLLVFLWVAYRVVPQKRLLYSCHIVFQFPLQKDVEDVSDVEEYQQRRETWCRSSRCLVGVLFVGVPRSTAKRLLYSCHFVFQFPLQNVTPNTNLCLDARIIDGVPSAKKGVAFFVRRFRRRRRGLDDDDDDAYLPVRPVREIPQDSEGRRRRARDRRRAMDVQKRCRF
jgi:hypothetical protein